VIHLLEIFNNALSNNDYYICLYKNHLYIYKYLEIVTFNNDLIIIRIPNCHLKIRGNNMLIKKMHEHELLIEGDIKEVRYE